MKKEHSKELSKQQSEEVAILLELSDERIDTSDIPEVRNWSGARRNPLYRPMKQQITLRLDGDVIAWFRSNVPGGKGYQTEINRVLREYARATLRSASAKNL